MRIKVVHQAGDQFEIGVRGHRVLVDQPLESGGKDTGPTPTELFVGSLAACVGFYARRYLVRHGLPEGSMRVEAEALMATDRPSRVGQVRLRLVGLPALPARRREGLLAVARHCTVHNSLEHAPEIRIELPG